MIFWVVDVLEEREFKASFVAVWDEERFHFVCLFEDVIGIECLKCFHKYLFNIKSGVVLSPTELTVISMPALM